MAAAKMRDLYHNAAYRGECRHLRRGIGMGIVKMASKMSVISSIRSEEMLASRRVLR